MRPVCAYTGMVKQQLCLFLLLGLFILQAALPAGYMPSWGKDGKMSIVICTIDGYETVEVDADQAPFPAPVAEDDDHPSSSPCPYSVLAFADRVPAPFLGAQSVAFENINYHISGHTDYAETRFFTYYSRGPPSFVL